MPSDHSGPYAPGSIQQRMHDLLHRPPLPGSPSQPFHHDYLMALFSQIAYEPTRFEAANARRTSVVPSKFFQERAAQRRSTDIAILISRVFPEAGNVAVRRVVTANSVTTLIRIREVVIIASRGTAFFRELTNPLHDAAIDLTAWHIPFAGNVRYHFGFLEEACASLPDIRAAYEALCAGSKPSLPIYFTGHSLGGALSAIMDRLWHEKWPDDWRSATVFGCPRFGDRAAVALRPLRAIERARDPVTWLPPKFFGYASAPDPVHVRGPDRIALVWLVANHAMEKYRRAIAERERILDDDAILYSLFKVALAPDPGPNGL